MVSAHGHAVYTYTLSKAVTLHGQYMNGPLRLVLDLG
jgi:hypothetical protein